METSFFGPSVSTTTAPSGLARATSFYQFAGVVEKEGVSH